MILEALGIVAVVGVVYGLIQSRNEKEKVRKKNNSNDEPNDKPHLKYIHNGRHRVNAAKVIIINPKRNIEHTIIEDDGFIYNFPGFEHPELISEYLEDVSDAPYVRFEWHFNETDENSFMFRWEIQPDGRYWADEDGFGAEKGAELILYAYLNDVGQFTSKFRIYSYGATEYFGTDLEDKEATQLKQKQHE